MRATGILAALAIAALVPADSHAQGKGGSLKEAISRCTAVRSMFDRLKCFDQLARDVRDYDEVVAEACACRPESETAPATASTMQRAPVAAVPAKTPSLLSPRPGAATTADAAGGRAAASRAASQAQREGYGTGKWKQIPRYRDDGLMIAVKIELIAEHDIRGQSQKVARPVMTINCADIGMSVWMETSFTSAGDDTPVTMQFDDEEPYVLRWANTTDGKYMGIWNFGEEFTKKAMEYDRLKITFKPDGANTTSTTFDMRGLLTAAKPLRQLCIW